MSITTFVAADSADHRPISLIAPSFGARDLLPPEQPLAMPEQDFVSVPALWKPDAATKPLWIPRAALAAGSMLLTVAFGVELFNVLSFVQMTPIQLMFLVLSTIAFGWIALGTLSAAAGFLPLFAGDKADTITIPPADGPLNTRTALLFPVYHEDPARIAATVEAVAEQLSMMGRTDAFDVFILSDTRGETAGLAEQAVYLALAEALEGRIRIFYRRRPDNAARKSGNIKDWVERFGGGYQHFIILDGDSIMSGETLVRLVLAMESQPRAGLIQTVPRLVGGRTLFQRLQQFAGGMYGPSVAAGLAVWHGHQGNYWGHNAIIRTSAFASAAGLPPLPGRAPFGGHIQSHDFVEAVLLQRAGWGVHMAPTALGSYEGSPPSLLDLVVRDRRWAQGNLQHLAIVQMAHLTSMGRVHLIMGAMSYIVSVVWALSLLVGLVLALQGERIIPSYFQDSKTLFPVWPVIDPGAALRLFLTTMLVVLLPKALGLALELKRVQETREVFGMLRATCGVLVETVASMLFAPILMATQTGAVLSIVLHRDSGWKAQRRDEDSVPLETVFRFHRMHALLGLLLALLCWYVSRDLLAWMGPVVAGLLLSVPITWATARPAGRFLSWLLSIEEDRNPPAILEAADRHGRMWRQRMQMDAPPAVAAAHAASERFSFPRAA